MFLCFFYIYPKPIKTLNYLFRSTAVTKTTKSRLLSFHGVLWRARKWVIAYRTSSKAKAFLKKHFKKRIPGWVKTRW